MMSVDVIGDVRRAYFEQKLSIKEIVRTLSVSRATVRKVVRSHKTEFKYERGVQPVPKLGAWVEILTAILEKEIQLPRRERRSTQRLFEELRGHGLQNSVQNFPDSRGKQRPIVSTLDHAIIRRLRWRIWGVAHGYDCRDPASAFDQQGEHQLDRA